MNTHKHKKNTIRILPVAALIVLLVAIPFTLYTLFHARSARAEWFNSAWSYRQAVRFGNTGSAVTDQKVLIAIDTATLITAGKLQSSCQDVRFTDAGGKLLQYYINVSGGAGVGCNDASSDFYVLMPSIVAGENLIYVYYGNPSALAGTSSANFGNTIFSPTSGPTASTEEIGAVPFLSYNFDTGYGTTVSDASGNGNHGTITNASWKTSESCISNGCLQFNGSTTYVKRAVSNFNSAASYGSIEAWVRVSSYGTGGYIFASGDDGSANRLLGIGIDSSGRLIVYQQNNDTSDIIVSENTVTLNQWTHVAVVSSGSGYTFYINGESQSLTVSGGTNSGDWFADTTLRDNITVGVLGWNSTNNYYINGTVDELKIYNTARTREQIVAGMNTRTAPGNVSAVLGAPNMSLLSNGLVGYWKMDENTGTSVSDYSGNGNTGTFTNSPAWGTGKFGSGVQYADGTTDKYVSVSPSSSINNLSSLTYATWVRLSTLTDDVGLFGKAGNIQFWINEQSSGQFRPYFSVNHSGDDISVPLTSDSNLSAGVWYHLAVTWDGSTSVSGVRMYINGVEQARHANSTSATGSKSDDSGNSLMLGNRASGVYQVNGTMDESRVYNRALSPTEVRQLYSWAPGPIGHWKLDENTGTTAYDSSGNGRNGTLTNLGTDDWVPGKIGSGVDFDNANDYISIADADVFSINTTNQFTVEAWFNPSDLTLTQEIVNKGSGGNYEWAIRINGDGSLLAYVYTAAGGSYLLTPFATTLQNSTWYHIAMTVDLSAPSLKLYLNGRIIAEDTTASGSYANGSADVRIGDRVDGIRDVDGIVDDVRIYNYARTPSQIVEDMNGGHPPAGSPVGSAIINLKFDELQGSSVGNFGYGGSGYNGSISGATWYPGGKNGGAISTATSTNFVGMGDQTFVDNATGLTTGFWVKPISLATNKALVSKSNMSSQNSFAVVTDNSASDEIRVHIPTSTSDTSTYFLTSNLNLANDTWSYVSVIYNASESASTRVRVYKDGKAISGSVTGTLPDKMTTGTTSLLKVGASDSGSYTALNAVFDDMKIYPYPLTYDQMLIDYNGKAALQLGSLSTHSDGATASNSATREFCVPGDTTSCAPPIGWWKMDENTGTTAYDSSGNGNNAMFENGLTSRDWIRGKTGPGISLVGAQKDALITNSSLFDFGTSTPFTVSIWVKAITGGLHNTVMTHSGSVAGGLEIYISETTNTIRASLGAGGTYCALAGTTNLVDNAWHYISVVYNRNASCTTSDILVYIDGIRESTSVSDSSGNSNANVDIGGIKIGSSGDTKGVHVDQLLIHNYARSPAQIAWEYNKGAPIAHYKFDECQGSTVYNVAPNADGKAAGINGTITIGASGTYTSAGTCGSGTSTEAWNGGTTGKFGSALAFDGTNDNVSLGDNFDFVGTSFSVCAWVYPTGDTNDGYIVGKYDVTSSKGFWLRRENNTDFTSGTVGGGGIQALNAVSLNAWQHVCSVIVPTPGTSSIYKNGALLSSLTTVAATEDNARAMVIGDRYDGLRPFSGMIDDVRIYNYALTTQQIRVIMNENGAVRFGP